MPNVTTKAITARFHAAVAATRRFWQKLNDQPDRGAPRLRFWPMLIWQTFTSRDLQPLSREMLDTYVVYGLENIPAEGIFSLAANHTSKRWLPRLLAAVHAASNQRRPDLAANWLVITGYRQRPPRQTAWARFLVRQIRKVHAWIFRRWEGHLLRLPMEGASNSASVQSLREWRQRARRQPTIVFPEGRGAATFQRVRPGSGRWLATLGVPVLPVAAWWDEPARCWQVAFGPPIEWSDQSRLHDLQLGLEIASLLPTSEAPDWQDHLRHWATAHHDAPTSEEAEPALLEAHE